MSICMETETRAVFQREADDILAELEAGLMELEATPQDTALVDRVFRALHTLKGSGSMFGYSAMALFTHELETAFDLVRQGRLAVSGPLLDATLEAKDLITGMLRDPEATEAENCARIIGRVKGIVGAGPDGQPREALAAVGGPQADPTDRGESKLYRLRFKPWPDIFLQGADPLKLLDELREMGPCKVVLHAADIPTLDNLDPERCHVFWDVILCTDRGQDAIRDVFMFVEDESELHIHMLDEGMLDGTVPVSRLGEILMEKQDVSSEDLKRVLQEQPIGQRLISQGLTSPEAVEAALAEQEMIKAVRTTRQRQEPASIRVEAAKLDSLVDLVGELVILQSKLSRAAAVSASPAVNAVSEELERLSAELRDKALSLRMQPIDSSFGRLRRLARDLAKELGKEVEFSTLGGETELDKTMLERLADPLVHMLRNSMDHGIEPPDVREASGKPRKGRVLVAASQSGGEVRVEVRDDGKGIDAAKLLAKARERGLVAAGENPPIKDVLGLIFAPGLSTAKAVTNVSGRGVGMDVVRESVNALGGRIEVESNPGQGTCMTIRLPLTLAIIHGLEVQIGRESFVLPLSMVEECVELDNRKPPCGKQDLMEIRGQMVPFLRLDELYGSDDARPSIEHMVVVNADGHRMGLVVSHVRGELQAVIKNLGRVYRDIRGISGATVNGEGRMSLIIDVPAVAKGLCHTGYRH